MKMLNLAMPSWPQLDRNLDSSLWLCLLALLSIGLVMVASSSIDFAAANYNDPWYFVKRQAIFLFMGCAGGLILFSVPLAIWEKYAVLFLLLALILLAVVLVPGIGKMVNGSRRWLTIGSVGMQASEVAKFCLVLYFASYLARKNEEMREGWLGFFKVTGLMVLVVLLLLLEPDFGSCVVLGVTIGAMMFLAGVPFLRFVFLGLLAAFLLGLFVKYDPVRLERLLAFMNPWEKQYDSGYQLVQSLIAFGRGEWFGLGLGNSIQKLFFLPEAHTDFVFAIFAEEFGLLGALILLGLYVFFIWKLISMSKRFAQRNNYFACYLLFGIAILFATQVFINMGVAAGLLPTKGLTLPFVSYGGSSLLITFGLIALVLRANWELNNV